MVIHRGYNRLDKLSARTVDEGMEEASYLARIGYISNGVVRRNEYIEEFIDIDDGGDVYDKVLKRGSVIRNEIVDEYKSNYGLDYKSRSDSLWEYYFSLRLDSLDSVGVFEETVKYLDMISGDSSAVQEYRMCVSLLDRLIFCNSIDCDYRIDTNGLTVEFNGGKYYFPTVISLENGKSIRVNRRIYNNSVDNYSENGAIEKKRHMDVVEIMRDKDLDSGFLIFLENMGYGSEMSAETRREFLNMIDFDAVAAAISGVEVNEYINYGFPIDYHYDSVVHLLSGENVLLDSLVKEWSDGSDRELYRVSSDIGVIIGRIFARTSKLDAEEAAFLLGSGILENDKVRSAVSSVSKRISEERWEGIEIDTVKDIKVMALYSFVIREIERSGDLGMYMDFADYLESPDFRFDMTRGNDTSVFLDGYLSGVPEHKGKAAGYPPGIYCGILGAFYNWSQYYKVIIHDMPLKFVDDIRGRGETILECAGLKVDIIRQDINLNEGGRISSAFGLCDASNAEVIPYVDPASVEHMNISYFDTVISRHMLDVFQRYFADARIEEKTIRNTSGDSVVFPFLVLPPEAKGNIARVNYLKSVTGVNNVVLL